MSSITAMPKARGSLASRAAPLHAARSVVALPAVRRATTRRGAWPANSQMSATGTQRPALPELLCARSRLCCVSCRAVARRMP